MRRAVGGVLRDDHADACVPKGEHMPRDQFTGGAEIDVDRWQAVVALVGLVTPVIQDEREAALVDGLRHH